jgi:hypothetical protein
MGARMPPAYWREYRRRNRERLNAQQTARRSSAEDKARRAEYRGRPEVRERVNAAARQATATLAVTISAPYTGHPILEEARRLAGSWYGATLYDATREDAAGEAVLAMLEGRDPAAAVRAVRAAEVAWERLTTTLPDA